MAVKGVIQSDQLRNEVMRQLLEYTNGVGEIAQESSEKYAKLGAKLLKINSPVQNVKGGGAYARGWRAKRVGSRWVVHNATDYQLTHLLEHGHVSKNGTQRTFGPVGAKVHIKPVEERLIREFVAEVEEAIKKG